MVEAKKSRGFTESTDIVVLTNENITDLYRMDVFLVIPGCQGLSVGIAFEDNEIDLFSALGGTPRKFMVEDPVTSGAASEYTPGDAILVLLAEAGITVTENGTFSVPDEVKATSKSLTDFEKGVVGDTVDTSDTREDLVICVENAYADLEWE